MEEITEKRFTDLKECLDSGELQPTEVLKAYQKKVNFKSVNPSSLVEINYNYVKWNKNLLFIYCDKNSRVNSQRY